MENTQKKKSRVSEFVIVILVILCAFLVIADMTTNVIADLDTQRNQVVIESTGVSTPKARPTYPPNYTPPPVNEAN